MAPSSATLHYNRTFGARREPARLPFPLDVWCRPQPRRVSELIQVKAPRPSPSHRASKGTWDRDTDPAVLGAARVAEQEEAGRILGAAAVHHLSCVDGELTNGRAERARVCEVIRRTRPDVLLTHDPWKRYRLHPDHRNAGLLTLDAVVAARDPHFFPEQRLEPHRPDVVLLFEAEVIDHYERVDATFAAKVNALLAHRSQWHSTMGIDASAPDAEAQHRAFVARLRCELEELGAAIGGGLAEGFKRIDEV